MKTLFRLAIILSVLSAGVKPLLADQAPSPAESGAIETVKSYLGALITGDTMQLRGFLAPAFIEERRTLLDNPDYPRILQSTYASATFDIIGSQQMDDGKIRVDVRISLKNRDVIHSRLLLVRVQDQYYRIVAEN